MRRRHAALLTVWGALASSAGCGTDCDRLKQGASDLTAGYATCTTGDECMVVDMYDIAGSNNCILAFQCSAAVRRDSDVDAFKARARQIVDEYKSGCSECATASCLGPISTLKAECNAAHRRCEIVQ